MEKMMKLVRDKIPAVIKKGGRTPVYCSLKGQENSKAFRYLLMEKLQEEVRELAETEPTLMCAVTEELADILEVVDALLDSYGITPNSLAQVRGKKREENGSFENRIFLMGVE